MKKISYLLFFLLLTKGAFAQCCPYVGNISTHPHVLDASFYIKIIAQATTPNQATEISRSFTFDSQQNTFHLRSCYYMGTQAGPVLFMDTFTVGYLNPGTYLVSFKAFISSSQTSCAVSDSMSSSVYTLVVNPYVGVAANTSVPAFQVYPNPVTDILNLQFSVPPLPDSKLEIRNTLGQLMYKRSTLTTLTELDLRSLLKGVYYLSLDTQEGQKKTLKLVKE